LGAIQIDIFIHFNFPVNDKQTASASDLQTRDCIGCTLKTSDDFGDQIAKVTAAERWERNGRHSGRLCHR